MAKKLDKKTLFWRQAAVAGVIMEGLVSFKVLSHYTIIVWNALLSIPAQIGHTFTGLCEQIAHVFGA